MSGPGQYGPYPNGPGGPRGGDPTQQWGQTGQYPDPHHGGPHPTGQYQYPAPPERRRSRWPLMVTALVAVVALTVGGLYFFGAFSTEVRVEPVAYADPDAFTASVGDGTALPAPATPPPSAPAVTGNQVGLYGGTEDNAVCNPEQLVSFLEQNPDKAAAWAGVQGIQVSEIRAFVATLTPVLLRTDTAVVNHGFRNGQATTLDSVLQAGTAVLVDDKGVPRARCACGNPLLEGKQYSRTKYSGQTWTGFDSTRVTQVRSSPQPVKNFTLYDIRTGTTYQQPAGSKISTTPPITGDPRCAFKDPANDGPVVAMKGGTYTDGAGATYRIGNDCKLSKTAATSSKAAPTSTSAAPGTSARQAPAGPQSTVGGAGAAEECKFTDAGDGSLIVVAEGTGFTDSRGSSYYVGPGCSLSNR